MRSVRSMPRVVALCAAALVLSAAPARADVVFHTGEDPYLSFANSPWEGDVSEWDYFFFEDFEDFAFDVPGVTASAGWIIAPTAQTDSVDADDGVIDGSGVSGHSYFTGVGSEIRFDFNADDLGQLPTRSGLVWTDGMAGVLVTFEAFGPDGEFLGSVDIVLGDMFFGGTTDEDRFLGVEADVGISAIRLITDQPGMEIDHLQYGLVPGPAGLAVAAGFVLCGGRRRRRDARDERAIPGCRGRLS